MRVGVLALQGAVAEHVAILEGLGAHVSLVRTADDLDAVDGLVIPGGESTAMARLAAGTGLFAAIRLRIDDGTLAVFGTCAGLILLADDVDPAGSLVDHIGGLPVSVTRNGFGNQLASFEAELDLADSTTSETLRAAFIRAPRITEVGKDVRVLASYEGEAVVVEYGKLIAATCHPEISGDATLHARFLDLVP
ncbi:MAG: pyridoxal 5'-phosphate synthase glutaminase subunit PdxT [Ancrocorticia sp.]